MSTSERDMLLVSPQEDVELGKSAGGNIEEKEVQMVPVGSSQRRAMSVSKREEEAGKMCSAEVPWEGDAGIYMAVMAATFGGVTVNLRNGMVGGASAKAQDTEKALHPILLFILCIPVFATQISALLFLRTGLDAETDIYSESDERSVSLLRLKLVMVVVIYLTTFGNLVVTFSQLLFLANPITWVEVKQPGVQDWLGSRVISWVLPQWMVAPWPVIALMMRLAICYLVCADSVSIILSAKTAKSAIFDSLAITFVVELSRVWWVFCQRMLHLSDIEGFDVDLLPAEETWTFGGDITDTRLKDLSFLFRGPVSCMVTLTRRLSRTGHSFLRYGHGANRLMRALSLAGVFALIYFRQYLIILQAIDTKKLPAARDLCTEFKLISDHSITSKMWNFAEQFLIVSANEEVMRAHTNSSKLNRDCESGELQRLKMPEYWGLIANHQIPSMCLLALFVVVMVPTFAVASQGLWEAPETEENDDDDIEQVSRLQTQMEDTLATDTKQEEQILELQTELADLKTEMMEMKRLSLRGAHEATPATQRASPDGDNDKDK